MKTFRAAFAADTLLVLVTFFVPAFSGIGSEPGLADRIFPNRSGGFRGDVLWIFWSGLALSFWSVLMIVRALKERDRADSLDAVLGTVWIAEYFCYVGWTFIHMMG